MKLPTSPLPWCWREMGEYHLTTDRGGALIVLSAGYKETDDVIAPRPVFKVRNNAECLLEDFEPDHPDAQYIIEACNEYPEAVRQRDLFKEALRLKREELNELRGEGP